MPYVGEALSVAAALFWAIGVILFKRSGESFPPLSLNLFKNVVGLSLLTLTILLAGQSLWPQVPRRDLLMLLASGFFGIAVADTMFFYSLDKLGAGLLAVVDTSYTPMMLALSYALLGEEIGPMALVGAALIMGGLVVGSAARPEPGKTRRDIVLGVVVGIAGLALMAISIVMVKDVLNRSEVLWATWVRLLAGALGLLPMIALSPSRHAVMAALRPSRAWPVAIAASFFGSYLAMVTWIAGMKHADVHVAALLNQLSTVFIFALAVWLLREPLTWRRGLAMGLAFPGAVLVVAC
ncbi:MAG: DMT family transporter [Myxococcota bacterium]|jgi:drug/metabolite transporter (DMT)-like permease|nr:DMT family transporter [Myxococcota bacterium]